MFIKHDEVVTIFGMTLREARAAREFMDREPDLIKRNAELRLENVKLHRQNHDLKIQVLELEIALRKSN